MIAGRRERSVDVLVVGAGPAGLSMAEALSTVGAGSVEVVERESQAGGIPRHSHHTGYGLRDLHRVMTGPAYARVRTDRAIRAGAVLRTGVSVTGWAAPLCLETTGPDGLERLTARAVVLATGARERARAARWIPGDRPSGVLTTGQLQQMVYLKQQPVGRHAVVVGAEHVSYSAVVTLAHAGVDVVAMVTDQPRVQSYWVFDAVARMRWHVPVLTDVVVSRLVGRGRLEGVEIRRRDGATRLIGCDTVVLTGDWIPDHELARAGGVRLDPGTAGPAVDGSARTSSPGVFAVGNLVHPVETADVVSVRGGRAAEDVLRWLQGTGEGLPPEVVLTAVEPLAWVWPNIWRPDVPESVAGPLVVWSRAVVSRPLAVVEQDGRVLLEASLGRVLVPNRPRSLPLTWRSRVSAGGGPVSVSVVAR